MTGRRLYDYYCDAHRDEMPKTFVAGAGWVPTDAQFAWPFLPKQAQAMWNAMARALPKPRRR